MIRKTLYGWRTKDGRFSLSRIPPDVSLMPLNYYDNIPDAEFAAKQKRACVVWCGPALIDKQLLDASNSTIIRRL